MSTETCTSLEMAARTEKYLKQQKIEYSEEPIGNHIVLRFVLERINTVLLIFNDSQPCTIRNNTFYLHSPRNRKFKSLLSVLNLASTSYIFIKCQLLYVKKIKKQSVKLSTPCL